jgi:hypothetical protein
MFVVKVKSQGEICMENLHYSHIIYSPSVVSLHLCVNKRASIGAKFRFAHHFLKTNYTVEDCKI